MHLHAFNNSLKAHTLCSRHPLGWSEDGGGGVHSHMGTAQCACVCVWVCVPRNQFQSCSNCEVQHSDISYNFCKPSVLHWFTVHCVCETPNHLSNSIAFTMIHHFYSSVCTAAMVFVGKNRCNWSPTLGQVQDGSQK